MELIGCAVLLYPLEAEMFMILLGLRSCCKRSHTDLEVECLQDTKGSVKKGKNNFNKRHKCEKSSIVSETDYHPVDIRTKDTNKMQKIDYSGFVGHDLQTNLDLVSHTDLCTSKERLSSKRLEYLNSKRCRDKNSRYRQLKPKKSCKSKKVFDGAKSKTLKCNSFECSAPADRVELHHNQPNTLTEGTIKHKNFGKQNLHDSLDHVLENLITTYVETKGLTGGFACKPKIDERVDSTSIASVKQETQSDNIPTSSSSIINSQSKVKTETNIKFLSFESFHAINISNLSNDDSNNECAGDHTIGDMQTHVQIGGLDGQYVDSVYVYNIILRENNNYDHFVQLVMAFYQINISTQSILDIGQGTDRTFKIEELKKKLDTKFCKALAQRYSMCDTIDFYLRYIVKNYLSYDKNVKLNVLKNELWGIQQYMPEFYFYISWKLKKLEIFAGKDKENDIKIHLIEEMVLSHYIMLFYFCINNGGENQTTTGLTELIVIFRKNIHTSLLCFYLHDTATIVCFLGSRFDCNDISKIPQKALLKTETEDSNNNSLTDSDIHNTDDNCNCVAQHERNQTQEVKIQDNGMYNDFTPINFPNSFPSDRKRDAIRTTVLIFAFTLDNNNYHTQLLKKDIIGYLSEIDTMDVCKLFCTKIYSKFKSLFEKSIQDIECFLKSAGKTSEEYGTVLNTNNMLQRDTESSIVRADSGFDPDMDISNYKNVLKASETIRNLLRVNEY